MRKLTHLMEVLNCASAEDFHRTKWKLKILGLQELPFVMVICAHFQVAYYVFAHTRLLQSAPQNKVCQVSPVTTEHND